MKGRTKAPPQWLTRIKKKQKHNSTIPDAAGVVVRTDGALVPSESGGSDTTTPMLCDRGDASGSGGGSSDTTDPARTIQSFFVHLKGADLQQQIFMELLCIAPFVFMKEKWGTVGQHCPAHQRSVHTPADFAKADFAARARCALSRPACQLDAEYTSSKF